MAERRLVMLAYWYPPCTAYPTAASRVEAFARHLPAHGWTPTVVVPDLAGAGLCDCESCRDSHPPVDRGVEVVRVRVRPTAAFSMWRRLGRGGDAWSPTAAGGTEEPSASGDRSALARSVAALRALVETRADWSRAVEPVVTERLRRSGGVLWTTSWPYSHVRVGQRVARRTGAPWIADLRDPISWVAGVEGGAERLVLAKHRWLARSLRDADAVVEVTDPLADADAGWLHDRPAVIPSGFDAASWERVQGRRPSERFTLLCSGALYRGAKEPGPLLEGLRRFVDELEDGHRDDVRLVYHGRQGALLRTEAARLGIGDLVEDRGWIDPGGLRALLRGSDVLVLFGNTADRSGIPGGKFYDYLAAGPPVVAYPGGDTFVSSVLARTGAGASPRSVEELVATLTDLFRRWRQRAPVGDVPGRDEEAIAAFSSERRAGQLAQLLDQVVSASSST